MTLRTVLIDDEYLAIKVLEKYLADTTALVLLRSFTDPEEGLEFVNSNKVDLLFLDIQMPGLNGLDLVEKLNPEVMVAFTTARHDFAVKAFDLDVLDYLVKPVAPERFQKVVEKALDLLEFQQAKKLKRQVDYIMIRADRRIHKVLINDIIEVEGFSEYVKVHTRQSKLVTFATMNGFAEDLDPSVFVRVHKSHIIAMPHVVSVSGNSASMVNGRVIPIGRTYRAAFLEAVRNFGFDRP